MLLSPRQIYRGDCISRKAAYVTIEVHQMLQSRHLGTDSNTMQ
jgi:hypothetical protein